jgi:anti-sigma regulatory factor (Ser/Thr protein kinase)
MIASLCLRTELKNIKCEKLEATSAHYLKRMGLLEYIKTESEIKIEEHEPAGRFIPLTQIKTSDDLSEFIREVVPLLHLQPTYAEPVKYVISEVARNVLEHSCSEHGAMLCAQYYKKSNSIKIGITDIGIGIKKAINQSYDAKDDIEAIRLALTPGITGTTRREGGTEQNAGAGLFFIKSIAKVNRDFFVIYSGHALYKLLKTSKTKKVSINAEPFEDRHSVQTDCPYWQGTSIGIDITIGNGLEFGELMDEIRNTYSKAVIERKKQRYKKARFA